MKSNPAERIVFIPRTHLGQKLIALRNKALNSGMRLLSEKEILEELVSRRGGFADSDQKIKRTDSSS